MSRSLSARIGTVEVTLSTLDEVTWTVRTRWYTTADQIMSTGSKTFTGDLAWFDAAAFANNILADEHKRVKDPTLERPVLVP